jgi:hypothetical protein
MDDWCCYYSIGKACRCIMSPRWLLPLCCVDYRELIMAEKVLIVAKNAIMSNLDETKRAVIVKLPLFSKTAKPETNSYVNSILYRFLCPRAYKQAFPCSHSCKLACCRCALWDSQTIPKISLACVPHFRLKRLCVIQYLNLCTFLFPFMHMACCKTVLWETNKFQLKYLHCPKSFFRKWNF